MAAPAPPLRAGDRLTRQEFMRRWEAMPDLKWAELLDGVVYMPSPVSKPHGEYHAQMSGWLMIYIAATPGCEAGSGSTWLMSGANVPQPDLYLSIRPEYGGQSRMEGNYAAGAPEMIVEVSYSSGRRDAGAKRRLYEQMGLREYLMVRPKKQEAAWLEHPDGVLRSRPVSRSVAGYRRAQGW